MEKERAVSMNEKWWYETSYQALFEWYSSSMKTVANMMLLS